MTKLTLDDFIENPREAMRRGYYPGFMSCLALKASCFSIESLIDIKDEFYWVLREEAIRFPVHFLGFIIFVFCIVTTPFLFPVWAVIYWYNVRKAFKRYHEKKKNQPKLMINGVEQ